MVKVNFQRKQILLQGISAESDIFLQQAHEKNLQIEALRTVIQKSKL